MTLQNIDDVTSQIYFLECLSEPMLNTLLQKVKNEILKDDILNIINNDKKINKPPSLIIETLIGSMKTSPSVYISFYENGNKVCHVSIYLCPTTNNIKSKGPVHVTNNSYKGKTRRIRVNMNSESTMIKLGSLYKNNINDTNISDKAKFYTSYVIKILNSYVNKKSDHYLGIKLLEHPYLKRIQKLKNNALNKLRNTRKNKNKNSSTTKNTQQCGKN